MIAVDTNVLARIATNDDPRQARQAIEMLRKEARVFVPKTVLLELEWVLRSAYGLAPRNILTIFRTILGLGNVEVEDEPAIIRGVDLFADGMDFADGLHLASSGTRRFVSFDARLRRTARRLGVTNISAP